MVNVLEKLIAHITEILDKQANGPHEYRHNALLGIIIVFGALMLVTVCLRLYTRFYVRRWLGWDDIFIAIALFFAIALAVVVIMGNMLFNWDRHVWDVDFIHDFSMIRNTLIIAFVSKLLFTFASTFTRLSLVLFYYRLIKNSGIVWYRWVLHASFTYMVLLCIAFVILVVFLCSPVSDYWNVTMSSQCLDEGIVLIVAGVLQCISDLLTTLLPIPIILKLSMPIRERIGVCVLLCLGIIVTITGVVRTYYIWKGLIVEWDETWYTYPLWIWATLEIDIAVICACAPALKTTIAGPLRRLSTFFSSSLPSIRRARVNSDDTDPLRDTSPHRPLRSTRWFMISRFGFQRTARGSVHLNDLDSRNGLHGDGSRMELRQGADWKGPASTHHEYRPQTNAREIR